MPALVATPIIRLIAATAEGARSASRRAIASASSAGVSSSKTHAHRQDERGERHQQHRRAAERVAHGQNLNTPKPGSPSGAFSEAEMATPSALRVSTGSMTPSSQSCEVE